MKSPITLWINLATECARWCCTAATRDCETVSRRFKCEGYSFLTITLANFGKDFEKSLDQGYVERNLFQGFSWKGGLPKFLSGFLALIFEPGTGVLLPEPSYDAIRSVRQLSLMFGKVNIDCSPERVTAAYDSYMQCELEVKRTDRSLDRRLTNRSSDDPFNWDQFSRIGSLLFRDMFANIDRDVYYGDIVPKHGPGATAERLSGNRKYQLRTWTNRLEKVFPAREFLIPNDHPKYWDVLSDVDFREPERELPVRVIHVPKTLKTPRIIAIEPTCMQYVQQGLLESFRRNLHSDRVLYSMIGFDSQEPNQLLAQKGSLDGSLATLDLSEASDRVSNQHVLELLARHSHLRAGVDACRSRKADVPGHGVIRLAKFASMGSALTFPFEAAVFLTAIFCGIESQLSTQLTRKMINSFEGQVRVFGDDIIIPTDYVHSVIASLEAYGFKVNTNKSFWTGQFRESCGKEYYAGRDVSICRVRHLPPHNRQHADRVISMVSLRNQLYCSGYWQTVRSLDTYLERILKGHFPAVSDSSAVLGRHSFLGYSPEKVDPNLHTPMVKGWSIRSVIPRDTLSGYGALSKYFLKRGQEPSFNEDHLERAGRPLVVNIKLGWSRPY